MGTATRADAVPVWHQRRVRIYDREAPLGYLLLVPTLFVLGIFLLYPFLFGIWLSITDSELGNLGKFIGLGNYRFELRNTDGVFYGAVINTFLYTGVTTVFKLGLGLVMALLLNQVFPFRRFVRAALLLPYIILPLLRPVLLVVLLLSTILTFADFQGPFVLTNGAPYNSTQLLSIWAYQWGIPGGAIGLGAAISLVLFPLLTIVVAVVLFMLRRPE